MNPFTTSSLILAISAGVADWASIGLLSLSNNLFAGKNEGSYLDMIFTDPEKKALFIYKLVEFFKAALKKEMPLEIPSLTSIGV